MDIVDVHYYPPTAERVGADAATVTGAGKVYIAGEYASTAATKELLTPLAADRNVTGLLSWSLFGHHDRGGFVQHDDGFTLHYPGDDERMRASVEAQVAFAEQVSPPSGRPARVGPRSSPRWTSAAGSTSCAGAARPAPPATSWERLRRGRWSAAHQGLLTDNQTPWIDPGATGEVTYRVVPVDRDGRRGTASEPVRVARSQVVLVDPLQTTDLAGGHENVTITPAAAVADGEAWMSWSRPGCNGCASTWRAGRV
ncbi:hypothetical protein GCM10020220_099170 [Nonomuraea rubra]